MRFHSAPLFNVRKIMVGRKDYQDSEVPDDTTEHQYMEATERIIRRRFALGTESEMSAEAKDLSNLAKNATAAHEDKRNGKHIKSP